MKAETKIRKFSYLPNYHEKAQNGSLGVDYQKKNLTDLHLPF